MWEISVTRIFLNCFIHKNFLLMIAVMAGQVRFKLPFQGAGLFQ